MTSREKINKVIDSLAQDTSIDIVRAIENVAREFISSGGYGSSRMHTAIDETITDIFRSTVNEMAKQVRRGGGSDALRILVDTHLSHIIEHTITMRVEQMGAGKKSSEDTATLCAYLHRDLKRLKDAAVRTLRPER